MNREIDEEIKIQENLISERDFENKISSKVSLLIQTLHLKG